MVIKNITRNARLQEYKDVTRNCRLHILGNRLHHPFTLKYTSMEEDNKRGRGEEEDKKRRRGEDEDDDDEEGDEEGEPSPKKMKAEVAFNCRSVKLKGEPFSVFDISIICVERLAYKTFCGASIKKITLFYNDKQRTYDVDTFRKELMFFFNLKLLDTITIDNVEVSWRSFSRTLKSDTLSNRLYRTFNDPQFKFCDVCDVDPDNCESCDYKDVDQDHHPDASASNDYLDYKYRKNKKDFYNHVIDLILQLMELRSK